MCTEVDTGLGLEANSSTPKPGRRLMKTRSNVKAGMTKQDMVSAAIV